MKQIILDFAGAKSLLTLHEYLKTAFQFPEYYGHNMDALWDCLYCSFEFPTIIVLKNLDKIPKTMNEAVERMLSVFDRLQKMDSKITVRVERKERRIL